MPLNQLNSAHSISETKQQIQHRKEAKRQAKEYRANRWARFHGEAKKDVELVSIFREMGIDFYAHLRDQLFKLPPARLEFQKVALYPSKALYEFLQENYDVQLVLDEYNQKVFHFPRRTEDMNFAAAISEGMGVKTKEAKAFLAQFTAEVQAALKKERKVRIPELGIFSLKFRAAKPKRMVRNPFTNTEQMAKAKPASNKLRFSPAKSFKEFVAELPVEEPKRKGSKGKKEKKSKPKK